MPETKYEKLFFSLIMVFVMVYFMTLYNAVYKTGFKGYVLLYALLSMWPEALGAFFMQKFIGGPLSSKLIYYFIDFKKADKKTIITARRFCTVLVMAPCMTLFVSILHNGLSARLPLYWGASLARNFGFALCLQLFLAGPFVNFVFQIVFRRKSEA
ncbi:hypothetical protein Emin_1003 [Elusimicrobium minutum Pei191]|uniref:DUF2798 domain-containing protein n=1 Tax=Elusimicrobium minutum (strain Pei191) TaxID=445932 RepID=B2KDG0_ELUMP|nr:hypothetical protein [Elusimicrobium minutum]ACC98556.1 hypothetical protein Emin_1003 [Elusimicrobium minutum Pei191]